MQPPAQAVRAFDGQHRGAGGQPCPHHWVFEHRVWGSQAGDEAKGVVVDVEVKVLVARAPHVLPHRAPPAAVPVGGDGSPRVGVQVVTVHEPVAGVVVNADEGQVAPGPRRVHVLLGVAEHDPALSVVFHCREQRVAPELLHPAHAARRTGTAF